MVSCKVVATYITSKTSSYYQQVKLIHAVILQKFTAFNVRYYLCVQHVTLSELTRSRQTKHKVSGSWQLHTAQAWPTQPLNRHYRPGSVLV